MPLVRSWLQKIDQARLEALYAEGAKLEPEAVCRLTLGRE